MESWIGEYAEVVIIEKQKDNWHIQYQEKDLHVLYAYITDLRPVIMELAKPLFNIASLPCIWTLIRGRMYILYRIDTYQKIDDDPSDEIKSQIQRLYTFQNIMRADSKQTFIIHRDRFVPTVYSIGYRFTGKISLSDFVIQKWFDTSIEDSIRRLLMGNSSSQMTIDKIGYLEERLLEIVKKVNGQYVWYVSDVVNGQIMFIL